MKLINLDGIILRFLMLFMVVASWCSPQVCLAQAPDFSSPPAKRRPRPSQPQQTPPQRRPAGQTKPAGKSSKFPAPEVMTVETKDGVTLTCTWFAPEGSAAAGKSKNAKAQPAVDGKLVAPFILLHDWDRSREDLLFLGRFLQLSGHAAIVPDLRGHGDSLAVSGSTKPIDRARLRKKEMPSVLGDIEACKKFLMRKNDAGEVNIDLLNVAAVGKTGILAMEWAVSDWNWAPVGSVKQGQDVKSLILIAPERKLKGVSMKPLLKNPLFVGGAAAPLPLLILYSALDAESAEESTDIYEAIEKGRSRYAKRWRERMAELATNERPADEPVDGSEEEDEQEKVVPPPPPIDPMQTFVNAPVPRESKPGSQLIASRDSQGVFRFIERFVEQAVLSRSAAYPWQKRLGK